MNQSSHNEIGLARSLSSESVPNQSLVSLKASVFPTVKRALDSAKTFTCSKCNKIGATFEEMAREMCPNDKGASHCIPIMGDRR